MVHDSGLIDTANRELLGLGFGEVAYLRKLDEAGLRALGIAAPESAWGWGLFSASGEALAVCPTPAEAWRVAEDKGLVTVSVH